MHSKVQLLEIYHLLLFLMFHLHYFLGLVYVQSVFASLMRLFLVLARGGSFGDGYFFWTFLYFEVILLDLIPMFLSDISCKLIIPNPTYLLLIMTCKYILQSILQILRTINFIIYFILFSPFQKTIPNLITSKCIPMANHNQDILGPSKCNIDSSLIRKKS